MELYYDMITTGKAFASLTSPSGTCSSYAQLCLGNDSEYEYEYEDNEAGENEHIDVDMQSWSISDIAATEQLPSAPPLPLPLPLPLPASTATANDGSVYPTSADRSDVAIYNDTDDIDNRDHADKIANVCSVLSCDPEVAFAFLEV